MSRRTKPQPQPQQSDLLDYTIECFQPLSKDELTRDDAQEIVHNLTGFFRLLMQWDREDREKRAAAEAAKASAP